MAEKRNWYLPGTKGKTTGATESFKVFLEIGLFYESSRHVSVSIIAQTAACQRKEQIFTLISDFIITAVIFT
jgi:hypothetical protein